MHELVQCYISSCTHTYRLCNRDYVFTHGYISVHTPTPLTYTRTIRYAHKTHYYNFTFKKSMNYQPYTVSATV